MTLIQNGSTPTITFLMVATSDHIAGLTGITPAVQISKNAGAGAASSNAASAVDATNLPGWYKLTLTATETNTNGDLTFAATGTGADPTGWKEQVVAFNPTDAVRLGLTALPNANAEAAGGLFTRGSGAGQINQANNGNIDANTVRLNGTAQTARDLGANVDVVLSTRATPAQILTTPANLLTTDASGRVDLGNWRGSAPNVLIAGRVDANAQVVGDKTGYTASTVTDKTGYSLTAGEHTAIATDTQTGLTAQGYTTTRAGYLDTLNGLVAAIWAAGTRQLTGAANVATDIAAAVWNALAATYNTVNTMGRLLNGAGGSADPLANPVPGSYAAGTAGNILGGLPGSVWDVLIALHLAANTTGQKLNAAGGASGTGAITVTINTTNNSSVPPGAPLPGVFVWAALDLAGSSVVASGLSDTAGNVVFFLNSGTYYVFRVKASVNFSNPETITV